MALTATSRGDFGHKLFIGFVALVYVFLMLPIVVVFIASLNDQVVPLYSGLFTAASHPLILRALYIDGDAYQYVFRFERTYRP